MIRDKHKRADDRLPLVPGSEASRQSSRLVQSAKTGAAATGASAIGTEAIGSLLIGALAIGAVAIGALAIGRLAIRRARIRSLEIDELVVRRLRITEALQVPDKAEPSRSTSPVKRVTRRPKASRRRERAEPQATDD